MKYTLFFLFMFLGIAVYGQQQHLVLYRVPTEYRQAQVSVDSVFVTVNQSPMKRLSLTAGQHTIRLHEGGSIVSEESINVTAPPPGKRIKVVLSKKFKDKKDKKNKR